MTRKEYEMIAAAIREEVSFLKRNVLEMTPEIVTARQSSVCAVAVNIAFALAQDNPRFDKDRFMAACGF